MSIITIDQDKCKKDSICVAECPFSLITLQEDGFPGITEQAAKLCIHCGHCVAVCPHKALSLADLGPDDCISSGYGPLPTLQKAGQWMTSRRSTRTYQKNSVDRGSLEQIIDICRWAPSARNSQPVKWLIIEKPAEVNRLAGLVVEWLRTTGNYAEMVSAWDEGRDMVLRGAPHLVVAYADAGGVKPDIDCVIAMTYFEMAASTMNLGTCWAGMLMSAAANEYQPLMAALDLPENCKLYGAMMTGYPKYQYMRVPTRKAAAITWR